jgi:AhpD family alkylhydroperoxidase
MPTNTKLRKDAEKEIKELMGFVPDFYDALPSSVFHAAWRLQRDLELGETVLEAKTKELIGLAVASHMKCKYCVYFHSTAAKAMGATDQELHEAALMGGLTSAMSNAITAAQVDFDPFKKEVDKALKHIMSKMTPKAAGRAAHPVH